MPYATPSGSLPTVGRGWALPFSHNTGNVVLKGGPGGHPESMTVVSANPAICPRLLMALACPLFPPSVGRALIWPCCQRNGRHISPVPKPHTRSPKKPAAQKPRAEAPNVFAVRIGDRCFGHTDHFAALVDLAPVHPTVLSSERAEVDLE